MSIKALSDEQLHHNLLNLKSKESQIIASIICHLEEVYRRRLFAVYKCSSIYDYCIRILGYSNGEAHRKISACKLASQHNGVKESIAKGELSLSNAVSVQVFLNKNSKIQTRKTPMNPKAVIERVKHKSTRECEKELEKIAQENHLETPEKRPSKRHYGNKTLLKIYLDSEELHLLKSRMNIHCEQELFQSLIKEKLQATKPQTDISSQKNRKYSLAPRSIAPSKRALVFKKAKSQCENCNSKYSLQIDHKVSVAQGGDNKIENLRVLCRSCNQRAAIEQLGLVTMDKYLNR